MQVKIVSLTGVLDASKIDSFHQEIISFMDTEYHVILIDFTEVTFMDSSGLGAIILALKTVNAVGKKLYLCSLSHQIEMLFNLTNMNQVFTIYSNPDEFKRKVINEK